MQAVIIAAGKGVRMQPLTNTTPKPLLKVNGKPIIEYTLELFPSEVDEIIIVVGYLKEQIIDYIGNDWKGKKITYIEQKKQLGTGHALKICQDLLKNKFAVIYGDDFYCQADIKRCLNHDLCLLAKKVEKLGRTGVLQIDDQGNLLNIVEKCDQPEEDERDSNLVNTGFYVLDKKIFNYDLVKLHGREEYGLPQTIAVMAKDYPVHIEQATFWIPVGYPEDIKKVENYFSSTQN